jgi:hypothetical protein
MSKEQSLFQALLLAEQNGGIITYHFENGSKQVTNINSQLFTNEKGRRRDLTDVVNTINCNMHDLGATSFTI